MSDTLDRWWPERDRERECGGCTLCCRVLHAPEVEDLLDGRTACKHAKAGVGCGIFGEEHRPPLCSSFHCAWRLGLMERRGTPAETGYVAVLTSWKDLPCAEFVIELGANLLALEMDCRWWLEQGIPVRLVIEHHKDAETQDPVLGEIDTLRSLMPKLDSELRRRRGGEQGSIQWWNDLKEPEVS